MRFTMVQMEEAMEATFAELRQLRIAGQHEYAHDKDSAFANFERVGAELDIDPIKVALCYALKHKDGICAWAKGHISQREDVSGRINDLIVYLCLIKEMFRMRQLDDTCDAARQRIEKSQKVQGTA